MPDRSTTRPRDPNELAHRIFLESIGEAPKTPKARKAMANKLARIAYRMLKYGEGYVDKGKELYEQKYRQQQIHILTRRATELGLHLAPST
jgi:transposase